MANESPTFSPLYSQIKRLMLQSLEAGEWRPGEAIPSETELAARFGVSQGTVRKAIDEMAAENLLVRKQGKSTLVASHSDPRAFFRFLRLVPLSGGIEQPKSLPIECWRAKAGGEAARVLQLKPTITDPALLTDLPHRTEFGFYVGMSFTFLGGGKESLAKPFAGAASN